ncbi:MAG: di-heme oxidoredictase family protein [Hyphomicrobiaceae bacterium]
MLFTNRQARSSAVTVVMTTLVCAFASTAYAQSTVAPKAHAERAIAAVIAGGERAILAHLDQRRIQGRLVGRELEHLIAQGDRLFRAKFTKFDGAGRPLATQAILPTKRKRPAPAVFQRLAGLDAGSCASCHNDPIAGGAGDFTVNAFVSEGFTNPDFDTTDPQFSNERNTNHVFGAGLIELLAREMTSDLQRIRTSALAAARATGQPAERGLETKGIKFGRIVAQPDGLVDLSGIQGVDTDLVVRPFSQKGVIASLRQFTINALNHHHGMQAAERFGPRWTDEADFDGDGVDNEISAGDVSALVAWQATRPVPQMMIPNVQRLADAIRKGGAEFDAAGCSACHVRALPLSSSIFRDPGPVDAAGTLRAGDVPAVTEFDLVEFAWMKRLERTANGDILVPLFGDLKRHVMTDRQVDGLGNELLSQRFVGRNIFMTAELWGVGSTAPYGHRGDFTTLDGVIRAHGGEARASRDAYIALDDRSRRSVIAFLRSMVIVP